MKYNELSEDEKKLLAYYWLADERGKRTIETIVKFNYDESIREEKEKKRKLFKVVK